ncbi:MAG TPA: hypothetical protein VL981_07535 [Candidatus Methylacidiphilales bacterium]|nr:hypothetical protein [Candidatus Methylacidiphilales bacterium]
MPIAKISHPAAFVVRGTGDCGEPVLASDKTSGRCNQGDECTGPADGSYCQLFRTPKSDKPATENTIWEVVAVSHKPGEMNFDKHYAPQKYDYKCLCVTPILPAGQVDGFAVNYRLCGMGLCSMSPDAKDWVCNGDCDDKSGCECLMFRLRLSDAANASFKASEAAWEKITNKISGHDLSNKEFYHRCFCVKKK